MTARDASAGTPDGWRLLSNAAFVLTGMVTTVIGPVLPWLVRRWDLSDAAAGALFTAQFAGGLSGGAASGLLIARLGDARTLIVAFVCMSGGLVGLALGDNDTGRVGAFAAGLGTGFAIPTMNLLVARLNPRRAAAALSELNLAWGVGASLWPLIVGLATYAGGTHVSLLGVAALASTFAFAIRRRDASHAVVRGDSRLAQRPRWMTVVVFGLLFLVYTGVETAFGGWLPEYARRLDADTPFGWASAATVFWVGLTAGRAVVAYFLSAERESVVTLVGLIAALGSVIMLLQAQSSIWVSCAALIGGLGLAPVFPVTAAALSREVPRPVAGPLIALGALGGATVPLLVGAVSDRTGSLASGVATLLILVAIVIALHSARVLSSRRAQRNVTSGVVTR